VLAAGYLPLHIAPQLVLHETAPVVRIYPGSNKLSFKLETLDPRIKQIQVALSVHTASQPLTRHIYRFSATHLPDTLSLTLPDTLGEGTYTLHYTALGWPTYAPPQSAQLDQTARLFEVHASPGLRVGVVESYDHTLIQALQHLGVAFVRLDSMALANRISS